MLRDGNEPGVIAIPQLRRRTPQRLGLHGDMVQLVVERFLIRISFDAGRVGALIGARQTAERVVLIAPHDVVPVRGRTRVIGQHHVWITLPHRSMRDIHVLYLSGMLWWGWLDIRQATELIVQVARTDAGCISCR